MDYIIQKEDFRDNLSNWLFRNNQEAAEYLFKNKEKIPSVFRNSKAKLYRGLAVSEEVIRLLEDNKFVTKKHTSWSKSESVAKKFVSDPAFQISNDKNDRLIKVILVKQILPKHQILDIDAFVSFMGISQLQILGYDEIDLESAIKEQEVLIAKELKVSRTEYKILK